VDVQNLPEPSIDETLSARPGVVDLWYYFYEDTTDPGLLAAHDALMTPDERARHQRFHFEKDRRMFLATRALVRTTLSVYKPVPPDAWRFTAGEFGKPHIELPNVAPAIHFNLANTNELVVCAVSVAHESVGVDTERIDRKVEALRLAPYSEQQQRFFTYWTLKESYIKARGMGLALALDQFSFSIDSQGDSAVISFDPRLPDDPAAWRFAIVDASAHHRIAVGVRTGGAPLSLCAARVVPLARKFPSL
jgi:4'-phosphopantetheinyl transferase